MALAQHKVGSFLEAARELAPLVTTSADQTDLNRELPADLASAIVDRGFFRMLVPRSLGGFEIDYLEYLSIVQAFGEADGSTAWCVNQNAVLATHSAKMPEQTAREIWSDERAVLANGPPTRGEAVPVSGGYHLTGNWRFSSGCHHATWMVAQVPKPGPGREVNVKTKREDDLLLFVPKEDVAFVDVWQVNGLRGTGSFCLLRSR